MFSISVEPERKLIRAQMSGFLSPEEVADFSRQEQAAAAAMGCRSGEFLLLVDTVDCVIQSQEVVATFMHVVTTSPLKAGRIAIVRGNSLTRMQTQRIIVLRDEAAIFATLAEAERWLLEVPSKAHAPRHQTG